MDPLLQLFFDLLTHYGGDLNALLAHLPDTTVPAEQAMHIITEDVSL